MIEKHQKESCGTQKVKMLAKKDTYLPLHPLSPLLIINQHSLTQTHVINRVQCEHHNIPLIDLWVQHRAVIPQEISTVHHLDGWQFLKLRVLILDEGDLVRVNQVRTTPVHLQLLFFPGRLIFKLLFQLLVFEEARIVMMLW